MLGFGALWRDPPVSYFNFALQSLGGVVTRIIFSHAQVQASFNELMKAATVSWQKHDLAPQMVMTGLEVRSFHAFTADNFVVPQEPAVWQL